MNRKFMAGRTSRGGLVFLFLVGYVIYRFFLSDPESPEVAGKSPDDAHIDQTVQQGAPSYAERGIDNSWPSIAGDQSEVNDVDELLTENYYILLDGSGSMGDAQCSAGTSKMKAAARAISGFVENVPAGANVGFAVFINSSMRELASLEPAGQIDLDRLTSDIIPSGETPLNSGIRFAYGKLLEQGRKQLGYGRYHLIVITDGMASSGEDPTESVELMLQESPVNLHTIGFCIGVDHVLNRPGLSVYHAADNPAELSKGLGSVLAESPQFDLAEFKD